MNDVASLAESNIEKNKKENRQKYHSPNLVEYGAFQQITLGSKRNNGDPGATGKRNP